VIVRHEFLEDGETKAVDSVYAHLDKILVRENQQLTRGDQVGTIGTAHGTYTAHLHFEIRKNLSIGYKQQSFAKDLTNYLLPTPFILAHRKLAGKGS
jgi:murein DD-endopeptidase MepM/ murein hydrolase activator NlpD